MTQCKNKASTSSTTALDDSLLESKNWIKIKLKSESFCLPAKWKTTDQHSYYYFSRLNHNDNNTYFVIAKFNIKDTQITALKYLSQTYTAELKDTAELFNGYTVKKLNLNNNTVYYCEFFTTIKGTKYLMYSMIFTKNGFFYDVSLKESLARSVNVKKDYNNIIYSMTIEGESAFARTWPIKDIEVIDLSKIRE